MKRYFCFNFLVLLMAVFTPAAHPASNYADLLRQQNYRFAPHVGVFSRLNSTEWSDAYKFGVDSKTVDRAILMALKAGQSPDLRVPTLKERDPSKLGKLIAIRCSTNLKAAGLLGLSPLLDEWCRAEAICEWGRWNIAYNHNQRNDTLTKEQQIRNATPSYILSMQYPMAVCWGINVTIRDIARGAGLKCALAYGTYRELDGNTTPTPNHSVAVFTFDNGRLHVPADVSSARTSTADRTRRGPDAITDSGNAKICRDFVLPRHPISWELFHARFHPGMIKPNIEISGDKQGVLRFTSLTRAEWAATHFDRRAYVETREAWRHAEKS